MVDFKSTPDGVHAEPTREEARQGQNIKGMVTVLGVSLGLVVVAYVAMLALFGGGEKATDLSPAADIRSESNASVPAAPPVTTPPPG